MKTYVTSDLHFGHANILTFQANTRKYRDVVHMDESMIAEWNSTVTSKDLVYILGDFSFTSPDKTKIILDRLNGKKILIVGNHDHPKSFQHFAEVHQYLEISYNKNKICMFHYPIAEWNNSHRGSLHFHGHLHGSPSGLEKLRAMDVGFDATGKVVTLIENAIARTSTGDLKSHH